MSDDAVIGQERRISERLLSLWEELRGDREIPQESDLDIQLLSDYWESCFMVEITNRGDERDYKYSYLGTSIIDAYGDDLTGKELYNHLIAPYTQMLLLKFETVVGDLATVTDESEFMNLKGDMIRYRQCLVPLGSKDGLVGFILGTMTWSKYDLERPE
jgi:hypothetical protein